MSLDISLDQEVDFGGPGGPERIALFDANITHNLCPIWRLAGVSAALYESEGKLARDILPALEVGLDSMLVKPAECRALNPSNGWGSYDDAVPWLERLIAACRRYPNATVRVCQ